MQNFKKIFIIFIAVFFVTSVFITQGCFEKKKGIVLGAKDFTEQYVLGNIFSLLLEKNGFEVKEKFGLGSKVIRNALTTNQIDICPAYTGTAWSVHLKHSEKAPNDPDVLYKKVKEEDLEQNNLVWLDRFLFNNTYALAIKGERIIETGNTLSSYANYFNKTKKDIFAVGHEFYERPDGFFKMAELYGLDVPKKNVKTMDVGIGYDALQKGQVDTIMVYSTDGKLVTHNLIVLEDNKFFFPIYNICPVVRAEVLKKYPELKEIFKPLGKLLDEKTMQQLNAKVDTENVSAKKVAEDFLKEQNLL